MKTRIHFLNTGGSDCIILESNNHFAMIDSSEDSDYPENMPNLKYRGYENEVLDYLFKHCSDENGQVILDFVLGTHAHSDHLGCFDTIIDNSKVQVKKAYLKPYSDDNVYIMEKIFWDNQTVYNQTIEALKRKNVPVIENCDGITETLGNFEIKFYNGTYQKQHVIKYGENINSIVTLVKAYGKSALLAADFNNKKLGEIPIANDVGRVDVLKVGHHGYIGSTSYYWIKKLMPKISIITNTIKRMAPTVKWKLEKVAHSKVLATVESNGVIVEFDENKINVIEDIM